MPATLVIAVIALIPYLVVQLALAALPITTNEPQSLMCWLVTICVPVILGNYLLHIGTEFAGFIATCDSLSFTTRCARLEWIRAFAPTAKLDSVFSTPAGMLLFN